MLAFSSIPSSLLLLFYRTVPESPRFLCSKGRNTEALAILEKIARMNGALLPSGVLVSEHEIELEEKGSQSEDSHLLLTKRDEGAVDERMSSNTQGFSPIFMLLSPDLAKSTLLLWVVFVGNAFSYYGLVLLTTELNNGRNKCGSNELHSEKSNGVSYKDVFITSFAGCPSP